MNLFEKIDFLLWNGFLIYLILAVGIFFTFRLRAIQVSFFFTSIKLAFSKKPNSSKGDISQFESLMTALAATIGIGSIAGMATAVVSGGFGAIFWMWVVSFIGMSTKYAESILAIKYRSQKDSKEMAGGPMYYMEKGLNMKKMGIFFSVFGILASFGGGNLIQTQSISDAIFDLFTIPHFITGIVLAISTALVILGGIKKLGKVNAYLVPIMAFIYISGGLVILVIKYNLIIPGIINIIKSAFNLRSAVGGFIGFSIFNAVQMGIARGISSNEAGLGSAPIAAAAAKTDEPGRFALISMSSVFLSSFVVCTITVLILAVTNVVGLKNPNGELLNGSILVMRAFTEVIPFGNYIVAIGVVLFGFSTILGWSYYGEKCYEYIFGNKNIFMYRMVYILAVFIGSFLSIKIVWPLADITNGLMAIPNLIALFLLSNVVVEETKRFLKIYSKEINS
ncbi:MAG: transporter [Chlamydiae bacterium RIFCSPHIGHO2_12_FULL_27_8]|nr:MAG: transporter [Chlamydiae bacterium RIFCSPHIGHO2_12_FULL_27_8]